VSARLAVQDTVVRMFVATDERDWPTLESCFTDPFTLDMTSMAGGKPATVTPRQVATTWAQAFEPLDHVHHQVGNFRTSVTSSQAIVHCYGVAFHHRAKASGLKTRLFVGTYELVLIPSVQTWLISQLTFKLKFVDGNLSLEGSA
ncbi:MAG TPA: nuclear transport factor 2 family protein, partial [Steroidobacteraceae bacterium]|nr:nuclear transport factor 2 family protein [Steroidobacteraceae bacterium]